jgi:hypothetical protein
MRAFQGVVALNNLQNLSGGYFVIVGTGVTELVACQCRCPGRCECRGLSANSEISGSDPIRPHKYLRLIIPR